MFIMTNHKTYLKAIRPNGTVETTKHAHLALTSPTVEKARQFLDEYLLRGIWVIIPDTASRGSTTEAVPYFV